MIRIVYSESRRTADDKGVCKASCLEMCGDFVATVQETGYVSVFEFNHQREHVLLIKGCDKNSGRRGRRPLAFLQGSHLLYPFTGADGLPMVGVCHLATHNFFKTMFGRSRVTSAIAAHDKSIVIGTVDGKVLKFTVPDKRSADGQPLLDSTEPVVLPDVGTEQVEQLAANDDFIVSADAKGCVRVWPASGHALLATAAPQCGRAGFALHEADLAVAGPSGEVTVIALGGGQAAVTWRPPCPCGRFNRLVRVRWSRGVLWSSCAAGHLRGCSRGGKVVSFGRCDETTQSVVDFAIEGSKMAVLVSNGSVATIRIAALQEAVPTLPILEQFSGLLRTGDHSDIILRMCGVEIRAHRLVLATRASFFEKNDAFEKMQEKKTPLISLEFPGVDADDFRAVITSLYTGKTGPVPSASAAITRFVFANYLCSEDVAAAYESAAVQLLTPELIPHVVSSCRAESSLAKAAVDMFATHSVYLVNLEGFWSEVPDQIKAELLTRSCGRDLRTPPGDEDGPSSSK